MISSCSAIRSRWRGSALARLWRVPLGRAASNGLGTSEDGKQKHYTPLWATFLARSSQTPSKRPLLPMPSTCRVIVLTVGWSVMSGMYDVVIVGNGIAGGALAALLVRSGVACARDCREDRVLRHDSIGNQHGASGAPRDLPYGADDYCSSLTSISASCPSRAES
jgi:hypothetical protein